MRGSRVQSQKALKEQFARRRGTRRPDVFISFSADDLTSLAELPGEEKGNVRLLLLEEALSLPRREFLETMFRTVIAPSGAVRLVDRDELEEIMSSDHRADLFIGGLVSSADDVVVLYRGNLERLAVPMSWFQRESSSEQPDFEAFEVSDFGQTIRFGRFEASTDAVLYTFDNEYRRHARRRQRELDDSFGAALRRARLVKGLSREDFAPVSAKTIARIERGEVSKPRGRTLQVLARKLQVKAEEIGSF